MTAAAALLGCIVLATTIAAGQSPILYGVTPGAAKAEVKDSTLALSNQMVEARWSVAGGALTGVSLRDVSTGKEMRLPRDPFLLVPKTGIPVRAAAMTMAGEPKIERLTAKPEASRWAERFPGFAIVVRLRSSDGGLAVEWRAILRDEANYVREEIAVSAVKEDQAIRSVRLFDGIVLGAAVIGTVKGSPVREGDFFFGFENPLAQCHAEEVVTCSLARELPLRKGQTVVYSLVAGVAPPGQMRRGFLNYVERERAHPYRTFLHYNTWYDIGFGKPYDAAAVLDVIHAFGNELVRKRGVKMDSFLLDDGWDNPHSMWQMNSGFPNGLMPLTEAAHEYGAAMGIWMSPWGGYNEAKEQRLAFGRSQGYETNQGGFALSGPKYYARFHQVSLDFLEKDGVNQFKIDGTGNVNSVFPGSEFDSDFAAAIRLMEDWREQKPDLYINLTTGTYPSPFWLRYADSIWRGGEDHSFAGVGTWREKWITYRDEQVYRNIVQGGPLFPLNSLMLHGLIYARQAEHLTDDPGDDFPNEVHDYFGSGTQLQEMYITHKLLSEKDWDTLAEAAKWSRRNAETLRDTHWVGGDPGQLEVYGWAAWSPEKGILTLRNPSDRKQQVAIDAGQVFQLPEGAPRRFVARSPWKEDGSSPSVGLVAGQPHTFTLAPFEVLTLEALPAH